MKFQYFNDGYLMVDSTEKPTEGIEENQMLIERDTGDVFYFDGTEWQPFGGDD